MTSLLSAGVLLSSSSVEPSAFPLLHPRVLLPGAPAPTAVWGGCVIFSGFSARRSAAVRVSARGRREAEEVAGQGVWEG